MAKVLIVEDDTQHLDFLDELVKFGGHSTFPVKDSELALSLLENQQVDFIITDISLPGKSGLEFIQVLHRKNIRIPFIIITGSIDEDIRNGADKLGALKLFEKPVDPQKILDCIVE